MTTTRFLRAEKRIHRPSRLHEGRECVEVMVLDVDGTPLRMVSRKRGMLLRVSMVFRSELCI